MDIDLEKLERLAKVATPGPWWIDSHGHAMVEENNHEVIFTQDDRVLPAKRHDDTGNLSHWRNDNDATYIAAANPTVMLALINRLRAAVFDLEVCKAMRFDIESERDTLQVRVGEMAAEVERLNGLLSTDDLSQVQQVAFNNYVESVGGEDSNAWHDKECDLIFYAGFDAGVKYLKEGKPCPHQ